MSFPPTEPTGPRDPGDTVRPAGVSRRQLLAGLGGSLAVPAAHRSLTPASAVRQAGQPATTSTNFDAQVESEAPVTLAGSMTTRPVALDGRLLCGTTQGLYVLTESGTNRFVRTRPVKSILQFGPNRVLLLVADTYFPNVIAYDVGDDEHLWSASATRSVYSQQMGEFERQVPVFDATTVGTGGGADDVVVAAAYGVWRLDGETGDRRWTVDRDSYTWRVAHQDGTIYATTQEGELLALDADSGDREFAIQLVDEYDYRGNTYLRSVWDVLPLAEGAADLAVSTEDGTVKFVDSGDGSVVEDVAVLDIDDQDEYYRRIDGRSSMPGPGARDPDPNFFNVGLEALDGGSGGIVARVHEFVASGQDRERLAFLSAAGNLEWTYEDLSPDIAGTVLADASVDPDAVFVPSSRTEDAQEITAVSVSDGTPRGTIDVPTVPLGGRRQDVTEPIYLGGFEGRLAVAGESTDPTVVDTEGTIDWSFPSIQDSAIATADLDGDGTDDYLLASQNSLDFRRRGVESRILVPRSGSDGSPLWSWTRDTAEFFEQGGLRDLRPLEGTSGTDVVGLDAPPLLEDDEEVRDLRNQIDETERQIADRRGELNQLRNDQQDRGERIDELETEIADLETQLESLQDELEALVGDVTPEVVVLGGTDGSEEHRIALLSGEDSRPGSRPNILSMDVLEEGSSRSMVIGTHSGILALDVESAEIFWQRTYRNAQEWPPFDSRGVKYRAIGGPGSVADLLAYSSEEASVAILETTLAGDELTLDGTTDIDIDAEGFLGTLETLGDRSGDGYEEVLAPVRTEDGFAVVVIAPGEGRVAIRKRGEFGTAPTVLPTVSTAGADTGLVVSQFRDDRFTVELYEELDRAWSHEREMPGRAHEVVRNYEPSPAAPAGDVDGDGREELALALAGDRGAMVEFYNVQRDERVDRIVLEPFGERFDPDEDPLAPGIRAQRIPDPSGEGSPLLGVVVEPTTGGSGPAFYVLDPVEGDVLASGEGEVQQFLDLEDSIGLLTAGNGFRTVDPTGGVSLDDLDGSARIEVSWRFDDDEQRVTTVKVDGEPVTVTSETSATIRLPDGEHDVEVAARDARGIATHDSTTVSVGGGSTMGVVLYAASALSVLALFAMYIAEAVRRRLQS